MDNNVKQAQDNKLDVSILHKDNPSLSKSNTGAGEEESSYLNNTYKDLTNGIDIWI